MNRKQNILLSYFSIALTSLAVFGFLDDNFGKLSTVNFLLIVLCCLCVVSLVVTRGENGIDLSTFTKKIIPASFIPIYLFTVFVLTDYSFRNFNFNLLTESEISELDAKLSRNPDEIYFTFDSKFILKEATISIYDTSKGTDAWESSVKLICNWRCKGYYADRDIKWVNLGWKIIEANGKKKWSEPQFYSFIFFFFLYIPIGMAIVFFTTAKSHFNEKIPEHVPFLKRFAFFAITYVSGIVFFPFFLNSWFTKEKKRSLLDDFNDVVNSASVGKSNADINLAIELAHTELLCKVISKNEISKLANEISIEQIDLSTNDLALVTALFFFSKVELKESLNEVQFLARLKLQEWIQAKSVNLIVAKMFEDTLYNKFK
jgi:hypothetical protein